MNPKRITAAIVAAAAIGGTVMACGSSQPVTYAPAAYGIPGHCYYVESPAEALALQASGLCPRSWVPTLMPVAWHEEYYAFYDSPAYYGTYVPVRARTVYVRHETVFGHTYRTAITSRSRLATYRSSSGTLVKGTKVGTARFGSGSSFGTRGQRYGGGSARTGGRSGTSSRSGGHGGGSMRSGGRR